MREVQGCCSASVGDGKTWDGVVYKTRQCGSLGLVLACRPPSKLTPHPRFELASGARGYGSVSKKNGDGWGDPCCLDTEQSALG